MQQEKNQKSIKSNFGQDWEITQPKQTKLTRQSPYAEEYKQHFQKYPLKKSHIQILSELQQEFSYYLIEQSTINLPDNAIITKIRQVHSSIIVISVSIPSFNFYINIHHRSGYPPSNTYLKLLGSGGEGKVFLAKDLKNNYFAIKSIQYAKPRPINANISETIQRKQKKMLTKIIVQYCIAKLCSYLKIGPYMRNYLGFDIIIYDHFVEYAMQYCMDLSMVSFHQTSDLWQSLKLMHQLKIIHGDIKPDNIMWSPAYRKPIFVDFGFSCCPSEKVGQMTDTIYFGTVTFSSPQMKALWSSNKKGYIDLYFNDLFCLKTTIISLQAIQKQRKNKAVSNSSQNNIIKIKISNEQESLYKKYESFYCHLSLMFFICIQNIQMIKQIDLSKHNHLYIEELYQLLKQKFSERIVQILDVITKFIQFPLNQREELYFLHNKTYKKTSFLSDDSVPKKQQSHISKILGSNYTFADFINIAKNFFSNQDDEKQTKQMTLLSKMFKQQKFFVDSIYCWSIFLIIISNIQTSKQKIKQIFYTIKNFLQIGNWPVVQIPEFEVMVQARAIREKVINVCSLDLARLQFVLLKKQVQKQIQSLQYNKQKIQQYLYTEYKKNYHKKNRTQLERQLHKIRSFKISFQLQNSHKMVKNFKRNIEIVKQNYRNKIKKDIQEIASLHNFCFHNKQIIEAYFLENVFIKIFENLIASNKIRNQDFQFIKTNIKNSFQLLSSLYAIKNQVFPGMQYHFFFSSFFEIINFCTSYANFQSFQDPIKVKNLINQLEQNFKVFFFQKSIFKHEKFNSLKDYIACYTLFISLVYPNQNRPYYQNQLVYLKILQKFQSYIKLQQPDSIKLLHMYIHIELSNLYVRLKGYTNHSLQRDNDVKMIRGVIQELQNVDYTINIQLIQYSLAQFVKIASDNMNAKIPFLSQQIQDKLVSFIQNYCNQINDKYYITKFDIIEFLLQFYIKKRRALDKSLIVLLFCDIHINTTSCNFLSYMIAKMYLEFVQKAGLNLDVAFLTILCYQIMVLIKDQRKRLNSIQFISFLEALLDLYMLDDTQHDKGTMKMVLIILKMAQRYCLQRLSFFWSLFVMKAKLATVTLLKYTTNSDLWKKRRRLNALRVQQFVSPEKQILFAMVELKNKCKKYENHTVLKKNYKMINKKLFQFNENKKIKVQPDKYLIMFENDEVFSDFCKVVNRDIISFEMHQV